MQRRLMSCFAGYYTVIYTVFIYLFFYFNPPNALMHSATAKILLQDLELHVVLIKPCGIGAWPPPVALWCDTRITTLWLGCGGWVCTPVTASPHHCRSACCQHLSCFISAQAFLFGGIFQKEGTRNDSQRVPFTYPQVSIQYPFSFVGQIFHCVIPKWLS